MLRAVSRGLAARASATPLGGGESSARFLPRASGVPTARRCAPPRRTRPRRRPPTAPRCPAGWAAPPRTLARTTRTSTSRAHSRGRRPRALPREPQRRLLERVAFRRVGRRARRPIPPRADHRRHQDPLRRALLGLPHLPELVVPRPGRRRAPRVRRRRHRRGGQPPLGRRRRPPAGPPAPGSSPKPSRCTRRTSRTSTRAPTAHPTT